MARLPQPGSDSGTWGNILNEYLSQTLKSDGTIRDNVVTSSAIAPNAVTSTEIANDAVSAAQIQDGTITEAQLDAAVQSKLNTAGSGGVADGTITTAKLQDGAVTDVKVAAGAAIAQSKIANLTTDLAGKAATAHTHVAANISDSTTVGRAVLTAADAAAVRSAIGAGTSDLVIGTSSTTAKAGDYTPTKSDVGLANVDNTSDATKNSAVATLTNKIIDGGSNTLQNIAQSSITGLATALSGKVSTTTTVNGHALSSNVTVTANDVLPTQTGNGGRYLTTDGTNSSWATIAAGGGNMSTSTYDPAGINQQLVGTSAAQTLTNKTIDASNNTLSNIPESAVTNLTADLANKQSALTATNVITTTYTAAVGDIIPADATSAGFTITLPAAPADKSRVVIKKIDASTNAITIATGGSDTFNKVGGSTSATLSLQNQAIQMQYASSVAVWYVISTDVPLSGLDARYVSLTGIATLTNKTISGSNNTLSNIAVSSLSTTGTASSSTYLRGDGVWSGVNSQVTTNNQTGTSYTLVLTDAGKVIELNNAAAITLTVPPVSSVAFSAGDVIELWQQGAGQVSVAAGAGVTIRSSGSKLKLTGQYSSAALRYRGSDEWVLVGDLTP